MLRNKAKHEEVLNRLMEGKKIVRIFIVNGFQLVGTITAYDEDSIMVEDEKGKKSIVFKRAVSTITVT